MELEQGAKLKSGGSVAFDSGGTLRIDDTAIPANLLISNFRQDDHIDLAAIAHDGKAAAAFVSSSTLMVMEDGKTYDIALGAPLYGYQFKLDKDNDGNGTDVTLDAIVPVTSVTSGLTGSGLTVTSAALVVFSGGAVSSSTIGDGGLAQVYAGGAVTSNAIANNGSGQIFSGGVATATVVSSGGTLQVFASGSALSTTVLAGGFIDFMSGALGAGVAVTSNAALEIDDDQKIPDNLVISGFAVGNVIDLAGIEFDSGGSFSPAASPVRRRSPAA